MTTLYILSSPAKSMRELLPPRDRQKGASSSTVAHQQLQGYSVPDYHTEWLCHILLRKHQFTIFPTASHSSLKTIKPQKLQEQRRHHLHKHSYLGLCMAVLYTDMALKKEESSDREHILGWFQRELHKNM